MIRTVNVATGKIIDRPLTQSEIDHLNSISVGANAVKEKIWDHHAKLLYLGIMFDGFRHGGSGSHREYISSQYTLIKAGKASQYGSTLRDSAGNDQPMTDNKLCALFENGADYVSKINQVAMAAEDSVANMTQQQLKSFECSDIGWPSNIYTYTE